MIHDLNLKVPEEAYLPLAETAKQKGFTPEELAIKWLVLAIHQSMYDPIEQFIGAFDSPITDWAERHDEYLGQTLIEKMNRSKCIYF